MQAARTVLIASALLVGACGEAEQAPQAAPPPPPPTVAVASVEKQDVMPSATFNGRIEAVDRVELRARVTGFLEKRLFVEGQDVKAGDLLFSIQRDQYDAELQQAESQVLEQKAALEHAQTELGRYSRLFEQKAAAATDVDNWRHHRDSAKAALLAAEAQVALAKLNVGYTQVTAPVAGRIGLAKYTAGNWVNPDSGVLAVIVSQDPMYATFPVSARELLTVRRTAEATGHDPRAVTVKLRLPDGSIYGKTGTINFVDVQVDPTTDRVTIRATLPNPQRLLVADQLVGVIVEQGRPEQALVIPQAAIVVDQAGPYVLVVDNEGKAEQRRVRPGSAYGSVITVVEGLKEGERVIVEGLQKVRPGQLVQVSASSAQPRSTAEAGQ